MGDFWKPTAEMYSSLFEKPKMAEKLLLKPPFKYLYDIIAECSKMTGFAKGLYTGQELTSEHYESRDRKVTYLQKMIDLVQLMTKEEVAAKPAKIVAGLEPEHTNALLQSIYKLATSGVNSEPFVKKVLAGPGAKDKQEKPKQQPAQQPPAKEPPKQQPKAKQPEKKPEPKPQPKPEPKKEAKRPQPPKIQMKEQQPAQKVQVEPPKVIRPPSAKKGGKPSDPPAKTPVTTQQQIIDDDDVKAERQVPKKDIQAANYSKKVQEAMEQEDDTANAGNADQQQEEEPTTKYQMGNLRKNKRESTQVIKGSTSGEITDKQLEMLKGMIQNICQNSTPLGKSIEFINDDIESMNQELLSWRKQYNESKAKMQNELKLSEDALVPLYDKLAEIEEQIKDQKGKIQNMKTQIIKNQSTIKSLLYSVVTTKS